MLEFIYLIYLIYLSYLKIHLILSDLQIYLNLANPFLIKLCENLNDQLNHFIDTQRPHPLLEFLRNLILLIIRGNLSINKVIRLFIKIFTWFYAEPFIQGFGFMTNGLNKR